MEIVVGHTSSNAKMDWPNMEYKLDDTQIAAPVKSRVKYLGRTGPITGFDRARTSI